jgi:RHS repeat-associated protein
MSVFRNSNDVGPVRRRKRPPRSVAAICVSLTGLLLATLLAGPVAEAAGLRLGPLADPHPVPKHALRKPARKPVDQTKAHAWKGSPKVAWPAAGTADVALPAGTAARAAGKLPVRLARHTASGAAKSGKAAAGPGGTSPEAARVQVLGQETAKALGVNGVVLAVQPRQGAAGQVDVQLDYSGFRNAYGGDWASRLTLRRLPGCALTTPGAAGCGEGRALTTANDVAAGTLTAPVTLPAGTDTTAAPVTAAPAYARSATGLTASASTVLLAADAAPAGAQGSYRATSLAPSASWSAGGSNGGFTWTYGIDTPEVPGGVQPQLSLGYSSQAVDGRTAATNNQANWIGDGWSMDPGYIERQYVACSDDKTGSNAPDKVADQCWKKDNAVINLDGHSNTLVKDDTTGEWHLESDDGTRAQKLTSSTNANGDNDGEYWKVTTPDGTAYYFGLNHPAGWTSGKEETGSTWTVPVYGNQSGEPCHATAYADSWCQQAWRWNLDMVVDPHGDAMTYYWAKESNAYARNLDLNTGKGTVTPYTRGGYLKRVEYGLRSDDLYAAPAAKVVFGVSERCLTDCGTFDAAHAKNWPDTPFDQSCASGATCTNYSPTFWTRKRLTQIDTSVRVGSSFVPVDTWKLTQQFPATGDGTSPALWLASLTRTGHTGTGDVTLPAVTFQGQTLPNRVEGATTGGDPDPVPPMWRYRVHGIDTETGGTIGVAYSPQDCKAGDIPSPASNTRRCYPVIWSPPDAPAADYEPYTDWFHTYVVTQVREEDGTAGAPAKETDYTYPANGMAWGKSEDEFSPAKYLTYGDRKGYASVEVRTGAAADARTLKKYRYFRGIEGAQVPDSDGVNVTDHAAFAGMTREEATYDGDGGALLTATSFTPWRSAATATMTRGGGLPALSAYAVGNGSEVLRTAVGSGWRTTRTDRTYDSDGKILTESKLGDTAVTGDERCTTTTYAPNTATNLLTSIAEVKTVAKACGSTPSLPADLVSDERHYYDGATSLTAAPTRGDVTRLEEQDAAGTGFLTTARHTYDIHGRELTDTDALNHTTTTAYTPATQLAPTSATSTDALGQTTTTTLDPARGTTTATVDPNGKRVDEVYDGLGRLLQVWKAGWSKSAHPSTPSLSYTYLVSKQVPNVVTTKALRSNGTYGTSYQFYDGLLRDREKQVAAVGTQDMIVSETLYDTRGFAAKTYNAYYAEGAPSTTLYPGDETKVPNETVNHYDGTGRVTAAVTEKYGEELFRTTTVYGGDRTTVIPPAGGTASTKITDALGRTTELRQYTDAARSTYQATTYAYNKFDVPSKVTDPAGNVWTYTFDNRGQQTGADDPDKGASTTAYDAVGRVTGSTDARGVTLTTDYDALGRRTALKQGSTTLASWTYDTVAKGQLTSSTRYVDGAAYTESVDSYDDDYQPTSSTLTVPAQAGALAGAYTWTYGYEAATGLLQWTKAPAVGDIPDEMITTTYNSYDLPVRTTHGGVVIVANTQYDAWGRPVRTEFGGVGKKVYETRQYDESTGRLTEQTTDRDLAPQRVDDTTYAYDDAGNVTGEKTVSGQDAAQSTDAQCFTDNPLGQLTQAWTTTADCSAAPSASTVGGPDAYWQSFSYDLAGNRSEETDHSVVSGGADTVTTYTQNAPGTGLPHAVRQATSTTGGAAATTSTSTFGYDEAGNTTTRTTAGDTQKLTWDAEGHLATLTAAAGTTSYLYDADGERLIASNADGSTVLTLPDDSELTLAADHTTKTATRYYTHGGQTVAVRSGNDITYLFDDQQGTAATAVAALTLAVTRRKQLPFGQRRGGTADFPGDQGFVGGTEDPTGLVHLGAREYDPVLGRFLSVDPVIDVNDPAQMNAYSYAHNNPATLSDPDGNRPLGPTDGGTYTDNQWAKDRGMDAGYVYKNGHYVWKQKPKKDKESRKKYARYQSNPTHYMIDDYWAKLRKKQNEAAAAARLAQARKAAFDAELRKQLGAYYDDVVNGKSNWADHVGHAITGTASGIASDIGGEFKDHWRGMAQFTITAAAIGFATWCGAASAGVCTGVIAGVAPSLTTRLLITYGISAGVGGASAAANYELSTDPHSTRGLFDAARDGAWQNAFGTYASKVGFRAAAGLRFRGSFGAIVKRLFTRGRYWKP